MTPRRRPKIPAPAPPRRDIALPAVAALAIAAITVVTFAPVRAFEFINYDDFEFVVDNARVAGGITLDNVSWAFANPYRATGGPITWLSHMADVQLFGMNAGPHHLVSLGFHVAAAITLFAALWSMTGTIWRSAFVATLFAVHPMHVESVAWISERKDVLAALAWFLSLLAQVRYVARPSVARYLGVMVAVAIALMCKPIAMTLPLTLLLIDVWPLARWTPDQPWRGLVRLTLENLPLLAMSAVAGIMVIRAQQGIGAVATFEQVSLVQRLSNAAVSLVSYPGRALWPTQLSPFYPYRESIPVALVVLCSALLIVTTIAAVAMIRRAPFLTIGWLWYVITMLPVSGLVQVGGHAMADRFTYIPFVGLFIAVGWGVPWLLARFRVRGDRVVAIAAILLVLISAGAARAQALHWRTSIALWEHAIAVDPANERAHANLGVALARSGDFRTAVAEYQRALDLEPGDPFAHNNLGLALAQQNHVADAISQYRMAVDRWPEYAAAHNNLANGLAEQGAYLEALEHHRIAIGLDASSGLYRINRAITLGQMRRPQDAVPDALAAIALDPSQAEWHYITAALLIDAGREGEARSHLDRVLALDAAHVGAAALLKNLDRR